MDSPPLRIECFDVSHIQGTDVVASMVVFEDGLARKSEYRRFAVRGNADGSGLDDLAAMSEVMRRRFARYRASERGSPAEAASRDDAERSRADRRREISALPMPVPATADLPGIDPLTGRPRRFAYPPQLIVVDGGQPQVNAVAAVLAELGITDVALCGLAKRLEEVWLPGDDFPVILPRTSEALYLLQRVRDEAHRFAITFHRQKRSKRMTASGLDDMPGLGETRRKALLRQFGSLKRLSAATADRSPRCPASAGAPPRRSSRPCRASAVPAARSRPRPRPPTPGAGETGAGDYRAGDVPAADPGIGGTDTMSGDAGPAGTA